MGHPVVGHGRRHDQRVGVRQDGQHGVVHLGRRRHRYQVDAPRRRQRGGRADQRHRRAAVARGRGQGVAHPTRRAVGDHAHGVDRLLGAARGDHHAPAQQVAAAGQHPAHGVDDGVGLGQPAAPHASGGQVPLARLDDQRAALPQGRQVALRGRVEQHVRLHRRRQDERRPRGEHGGSEQVVAQPEREASQGVRRRRGDDHDVRFVPERDVADLRLGQSG